MDLSPATEEGRPMARWEHKNVQLKTEPRVGTWSKLSDKDLAGLEQLQNDGWGVHQVVNIRGSVGFTSHVVFMLRRELSQ
jgi:hypothetical protein